MLLTKRSGKPLWLKTTYWKTVAVEKASGLAVMQGPFKGLRFPPAEMHDISMPQLLGTYEIELHGIVEEIMRRQFPTLVNPGGGRGFYTVGYLLRCPQGRAIAYEAKDKMRRALEEVAKHNGVEGRLDLRGLCTIDELNKTCPGGEVLLIIDVEGAERELLDPVAVPGLKDATILAELHPHLIPDIESTIRSRFEATHRITTVKARRRYRADLPPGVTGPQPLLRSAMREHRQMSQVWMYCEPRG